MISHLKGILLHKDPRYLVISAAGVGYKVSATADVVSKIGSEGKEVSVWTYLAVRENALDLYGFASLAELNFFELLITISGIGPKTALGILNAASIETLQHAIFTGDTSHLTKVSGIGKKNAEKIVMELKDKIGALNLGESGSLQHESDAMEALTSLGYSQNDVRDVLKKLPKDIIETGAKIKAALKLLGK
jgi:Holliday junction DNA helicase RuvA